MINLYDLGQVYLVCGRTDMRCEIDGLAAIVKDKFNLDPFSGKALFSVVAAVIVSKPIGTAKAIGCSTKDSKTVKWFGPTIKMKSGLYRMSK